MVASSGYSTTHDAEEDFSTISEVQRVLRGECAYPRPRSIRVTIIGMELNDFVAAHIRAEPDTLLKKLVGSHWILCLSRQKSERGFYAKVERAKSVTRKELFPEMVDTDSRSTEAPRTPARLVVPAFNLTCGVTSHGGIAPVPTGREVERMELRAGLRNAQFRNGLFLGFSAGVLTRGLVYIVALDAHTVCLLFLLTWLLTR
ncbi:hypothetical protein R1sor_000193 [Riccia sorocarpa]|uniref:Uncharacterized protein n=1 Tax=Riccia sorocarpa TaxID=122646 RepID=A0ABD3GUD5_9MARC